MLEPHYSFIVVTVLVAVIGTELLRLYIGCMGNLTEKVPELAGFRMMSLLLQFPLQLFLLVNENTMPFQMEHAVQGIMLSFLVVQIFSGFFFFCCEACFTTSSKLLSQDAVHTSI
ncbi:Transmembrane protein 17B [Blattella germanica]|nr:Transmembrane protein 17B [Blattella germanica]